MKIDDGGEVDLAIGDVRRWRASQIGAVTAKEMIWMIMPNTPVLLR